MTVDSVDIGKSASDPTGDDVGHIDGFGRGFDDGFHLFFGANEKDFLAVFDKIGDFRKGGVEGFDGLFEVDNVGILTFAVNIRCHFRVPTAGFVAKMGARF